MDQQKAYQTLGIEVGSNERDVRRAYRALLFDLEDKGQTDAAYPEKKKELEEAFALCLKEAQALKSPSATAVTDMGKADPEAIKKKLGLKLLGGVVVIGLILAGYAWFKSQSEDPGGTSPSNTVGFIAAIEHLKEGSRLVVFKPDGKKVDRPEYTNGLVDKDLAWRPDGSRLLFVSNQGDGNFNVHRWNPSENKVELRSQGKGAKGNLWFYGQNIPQLADQALLTSGGFVFTYDQRKATTTQILPPPKRQTQGKSGEDQGTVGQIDALYDQIGDSFGTAKWATGHPIIWSVMRRENDEVFVLNPLNESFNKGLPALIMAGKKIEFDVMPTGDAIVVIRQFQFPDPQAVPAEFLVNGKIVTPFDSAVFLVPAKGGQPQLLCQSKGPNLYFGPITKDAVPADKLPSGTYTFAQPTVSPDGSMVAFVSATLVGESDFKGMALVAFPLMQGGRLPGPARLAIGDVSEPSFSPENDFIVFLKRSADGKRSVYTAPSTGGPETKVSGDGDFSMPHFSPQKVAPKSS